MSQSSPPNPTTFKWMPAYSPPSTERLIVVTIQNGSIINAYHKDGKYLDWETNKQVRAALWREASI